MSTSGNRALKESPTGTSSTDNTSDRDTELVPDSKRGNDPNELWDVLSNGRRRWIIEELVTTEDATLSSLADERAAIENGCSLEEVTSSMRKPVYIGIYQCHLPLLNDADVVNWERSRGTVERGEAFVEAHAALEAVENIAAADGNETAEDETGLVGKVASVLGGSA